MDCTSRYIQGETTLPLVNSMVGALMSMKSLPRCKIKLRLSYEKSAHSKNEIRYAFTGSPTLREWKNADNALEGLSDPVHPVVGSAPASRRQRLISRDWLSSANFSGSAMFTSWSLNPCAHKGNTLLPQEILVMECFDGHKKVSLAYIWFVSSRSFFHTRNSTLSTSTLPLSMRNLQTRTL